MRICGMEEGEEEELKVMMRRRAIKVRRGDEERNQGDEEDEGSQGDEVSNQGDEVSNQGNEEHTFLIEGLPELLTFSDVLSSCEGRTLLREAAVPRPPMTPPISRVESHLPLLPSPLRSARGLRVSPVPQSPRGPPSR